MKNVVSCTIFFVFVICYVYIRVVPMGHTFFNIVILKRVEQVLDNALYRNVHHPSPGRDNLVVGK